MQYILIFNAHSGTLQIMWELSSTEDNTGWQRYQQVFEGLLSSTQSPLTRVAHTNCLYSNFHLDDLKSVFLVLK